MPEHKMVILGKAATGKTAIVVRFLQGAFVPKYDPTVEDSFRKNVQIDGVHYLVEILDTAGTELMTAMRDLYMKDSQGFIFAYSIADKDSFEKLKAIRKEAEEITGCTNFPSILVGNKLDLEDKREVSTEEAKAWADSFEDCSFMEVSAKLGTNNEEIFQKLLKQILRAEARKAKQAKEKPPQPAAAEAAVEATSAAVGDGAPPAATTASGVKGGRPKHAKDSCIVS